MKIKLHQGDIPADLNFGTSVAIDTETMGLNPIRDRLCLMQLSSGDGTVHLVQFKNNDYSAPNLKKLLTDKHVTKIFHFARADIASIWMYLNVLTAPVYCTKVASKLARTFSPSHSLKTVTFDLLGIELDKQQQSTDWGHDKLTEAQQKYAASDVLHLHKIREILDLMLVREGREDFATSAFHFLPTRALLDVAGWEDVDIFEH